MDLSQDKSMTKNILRQQLTNSLDLLDVGSALRDAGVAISSAGNTIMLLQEPPPEHIINELSGVAHALVGIVATLAKARAVR
jgi:hypothetical protein